MIDYVLRYGGWGLAIGVAAIAVPWLVQRELERNPKGTLHDPLAPKEQSPPRKLYLAPGERPLDLDEAAAAWERRWRAHYGRELAAPQLAPLMGQTLLANRRRGGQSATENPVSVPRTGPRILTGNNLVGLRASSYDDKHPWTVVPVAEWKYPRPVWRWLPIRAYMSVDAAAADWLAALDRNPVALKAIIAGDAAAYARAVGLNGAPREPELVALSKRWLVTMAQDRA